MILGPRGPWLLPWEVPVLGKGFVPIVFRTGSEGGALMDGVGMDGFCEKNRAFVDGVSFGVGLTV